MVLVCLASATATTHAQGDPPGAPAPATAAAPIAAPSGGPTLRNGFSLSAGQEWGSGPSSGLSGQLYGADWRIGAKLDALSVYLHSHLSIGTAHIGALSGLTGNFAGALIVDYTLPQGVFIGGGGGYGVLNNPSGPLGQLRAGWYPFGHSSDGKARHLNVALDARWYFAGEAVGTVTHVALSLGYDRF
ncbi:MAG: hypothetical protein AB7P03_21235 [Kofleriaceae bacterium]